MKKVGAEPTPLLIIKFQNYFQQCDINIPTDGEALCLLGTVLVSDDHGIVKTTTGHGSRLPIPSRQPVLPTASAEGAPTIYQHSEKYTEYTNFITRRRQNLRRHEKKKMKYEKYRAGLTSLRNLIRTNIEEYFVSAHNNIITRFCLVDPIILMESPWH